MLEIGISGETERVRKNQERIVRVKRLGGIEGEIVRGVEG